MLFQELRLIPIVNTTLPGQAELLAKIPLALLKIVLLAVVLLAVGCKALIYTSGE